MLGHVFRFELRHHFSRLSTYIYLAVWFMLPWPNVGTEGTAAMLANPPHEIARAMATYTALGLLVISGVFGMAVLRDFEQDTHQMFFTTNLTKRAYLGGRFLGCVVVCMVILAALPLGYYFFTAPWAEHLHMSPFRLAAYVLPFLMFVVPAVLAGGALCFALGALTRSATVVYLQGIVMMASYLGAATIARTSDSLWPALLDPFGLATINAATEGWTLIQRNTELIPLSGLTLWNRLLWCGVGGVALAAVFRLFPFSVEVLGRRRSSSRPAEAGTVAAQEVPPPFALISLPTARFNLRTTARQFLALTRIHTRMVVTDLPFLAIVLTAVALTVTTSWGPRTVLGVAVLPTTWSSLGGFTDYSLLVVIAAVVYAGELVWKTRVLRADLVFDALPTASWLNVATQFTALVLAQILMLCVAMAVAMANQLDQEFTDLQPGLYLRELFVVVLPALVPWVAVALCAQTLLPHKFFAHALVLALFVGRDAVASVIGSKLLSFGSVPPHVYSLMDGYGPYVRPVLWFTAYWLAWAALMGAVAMLAARRGPERGWRHRARQLRRRLNAPAGASLLVLAGIVVTIAVVIQSELRAANTGLDDVAMARYEREYKKYEYMPQPKLSSVELSVNLSPQNHSVAGEGSYTMVNRTNQPVASIHVVSFCRCLQELSFDRPSVEITRDDALGYRIYGLETSLPTGGVVRMSFTMAFEARGFSEFRQETRLLGNGTSLDRRWFPFIGYQRDLELPYEIPRRLQGLEPRAELPAPDDPRAQTRTTGASDADFIAFKATIGTSRDQTVIAPGRLVREWRDGDRRYFLFDSETVRLPGSFAIYSGRYESARGQADLDVEVFHDFRHGASAARLAEATLDVSGRLRALLGPPPFMALRIVEMPRMTPLNSGSGIVAQPEHSVFIARPATGATDPLVAYFAAPVARQWLDGQIRPALARGSAILTDMLTQFSADRAVEEIGGATAAQTRARSALNAYLAGRGSERVGEPALMQAGLRSANYLSAKGHLALRAIEATAGRPAFDEALRGFLVASRQRTPPYPTLLDLVGHLRTALPADAQPMVADWFERITLFDNRAVSATWREMPDGRYAVSLTIAAKKVYADSMGIERDAPLDDLVDIAVFGPAVDRPLFLEKRRITGPLTTFEVVVGELPVRAGIDPRLLLIDRTPGDNIIAVTREGAR